MFSLYIIFLLIKKIFFIREIDLFFPLFMHLLIDFCKHPDLGSNPYITLAYHQDML